MAITRIQKRNHRDRLRHPPGVGVRRFRADDSPTRIRRFRVVDEPLMSTADVARYLRYASRSGVLMLVQRGQLEPFGRRGRTLRFRRSDVDAMVWRLYTSDAAEE